MCDTGSYIYECIDCCSQYDECINYHKDYVNHNYYDDDGYYDKARELYESAKLDAWEE